MCANKLTNLSEFLDIFKKLQKASQIAPVYGTKNFCPHADEIEERNDRQMNLSSFLNTISFK